MKVDSHYVGSALKLYRTAVLQRDTMNFAAAVSDTNPLYFDDLNPSGVMAHPMQCVAITWPILEHIQNFIEIDDFPTEILATQVHYTEQLIIHRLIRPGDQLEIQGSIAAILPHRAGTHMITRLEALDQDKNPVFTEYIGGLMRGVECVDEGQMINNMPEVLSSKIDLPPSWESSIVIDPMLPFVYDGCTRIHFPIHTSRKFAQFVGLPDIILQGTATLTLAIREIVNREAAADPQRIKSISCRFTGMVLPESSITLQVSNCDAEGNLFFQVLTDQGERAISHGHIKLAQ
jgi:acyl dehydratase